MKHRGTTPREVRRTGQTLRADRVVRAGRIVTLVATLATILVVVTAAPAAACSCIASSVADQLERADVVFTGTVIAPTGDVEPGSKPIDVTFRVERVYKGTVEPESEVNTTSDSGSCGLDTPISGRYLMFANQESRGLVNAGLCSGTRSLSGDAPQELGPGTVVSSGSSSPTDATATSSDRLLGWTVVALSVLVGASVLIVAQRSRRRPADRPVDPSS